VPDFMNSQETGAGATITPLSTWRYRKIPVQYVNGALVTLLVNSELVDATMRLQVGAEEIVQGGSAVSVNSVVGALPTPDGANSAPVIQFRASPDDEIVLEVTAAAATTPFIQTWAHIDPL